LRVKDKRVLRLVKAFLKAGILTELGDFEDTGTGTPQGGILSPLLANIALSVLDEHLHAPWKPGGTMATAWQRRSRRRKDLPNWRLVRYADDFVVLTDGTQDDLLALRETIAQVLAPLGLRFSQAKTRIVHMSEGFDFLGFRLLRCPGTLLTGVSGHCCIRGWCGVAGFGFPGGECGAVLAGVKAGPCGWPAASLDSGCGRRGWRLPGAGADGSGPAFWGAWWAAEGLVVAVGVEGQLAQQFAGLGVDDADVEVGDEGEHAGAGVFSAQADVV
jgi:hypothetical protein